MRVDTAHLRAFAAVTADAGEAIDALDAIGTAPTLRGSAAAQACSQATVFVEGAYLRVADRMRRLAAIARGNADDFDVTESDFTGRLGSMGGQG